MRECILASASPRRREILTNLGIPFTVFATDTDETTAETDPARLAEELSTRKGRAALAALHAAGTDTAGKVIIASDTTVCCAGEILGKPRDAEDARRMLRLLSGRRHQVVSGVWLSLDGQKVVSHAVTAVEFDPLTDADIAAYLATGEPFGKAGAYAIQGRASAFIRSITGDYFNVVGLPVNCLCNLFRDTFHEALI